MIAAATAMRLEDMGLDTDEIAMRVACHYRRRVYGDKAVLPGAVPPDAVRGLLTRRQLAVLTLKAYGMRERAIGAELGISAWTVKHHLGAATCLLRARDTTNAVALALWWRLIVIDDERWQASLKDESDTEKG